MVRNKITKKGVALTLAMVMALGGMTQVANAANRADQTFELSFDSTGDTDTGKWRRKDNNSKVYVKVNSVKYSNNTVKGWIQGKKYSDSNSVSNCSGGYYYKLNKKGEQWMTNYVNEENLGYARIKASTPVGAPNKVEGVWSPDSAN